MYKCLLILLLFTALAFAANAQNADSLSKKNQADKALQAKKDSVAANPIVPKVKEKVYHPDSNHSPHKAVMHSLIIPGWGQLYNHQWYKVPFIYVGLGLLVDVYLFNRSNYRLTLAVAQDREKGILPSPNAKEYSLYYEYATYGYSTQAIDDQVSAYERNKELGIFGFVGAWGLQAIDAYIAAKFQHTYTMDDNLSLKVQPGLLNQPSIAGNFNGSLIPGLKLTFTLK